MPQNNNYDNRIDFKNTELNKLTSDSKDKHTYKPLSGITVFFWFCIVCLPVILLVIYFSMQLMVQFDNFELKNNILEKELGTTITLTSEELLAGTLESMKGVNVHTDIMEDINYTYKTDTGEIYKNDLNYLDSGEYRLELTKDNASKIMILNVVDSKAPTFISFEPNIVVEQYASDFDIMNYFKIEDYDHNSQFAIYLPKFNINEQGVYPFEAIAWDTSGNSTEKKGYVRVISQQEAEDNPSNLTSPFKGDIPISKTTMEKIKETELNLNNFKNKKLGLANTKSNDNIFITDSGKYVDTKEEYENILEQVEQLKTKERDRLSNIKEKANLLAEYN